MDGFAVADDVASAVAAVGCVAFRGASSEEPQPTKAPAPKAATVAAVSTLSTPLKSSYLLRILSSSFSVSSLVDDAYFGFII